MAASVNTSGSHTANGGETTLATITTAGSYQLVVDLSSMTTSASPTEVIVTVKTRARSTDLSDLIEERYYFVGQQTKPIWRSPPVWSPHRIVYSIQATSGSGTYSWAVYQA